MAQKKEEMIFTLLGDLQKSGSEMLLFGIDRLLPPLHSLIGSFDAEGIKEDLAIVD